MIHGDVLGERARLTPEKIALVFVPTGERLSYRDLDRRARAVAAALLGLGLKAGDRVGLLAPNRIEFLDVFFAAGSSGLVIVPLGTRLSAQEMAPIALDAGLSALVFDRGFAETARELQRLAGLPRLIAMDPPGELLLSDLVSHGEPDPSRPPLRPDPEAPFALLYTSGTTGKPKGVIVPHRMVAWNAYNTALSWQLREDDVSPIFTPLHHAGGLGAFLLPIFAIGGTIVLHARFDPAEVWRTVAQERCTVILGVPTIWKMLLEAPEFQGADLSSVRWLISGGAPLPLYLIEAYQRRGVVFKQGYGLTEVGVNCFAMTAGEAAVKMGSIGKPLMFTEARAVGPDGQDVPAGEVGELWLRGPHVSKGYWNNPEATAAALDTAGFFHTGDLARVDGDGFFTVAGRIKDMLISGGVNVYPAEIEGELLLHPAVADAAVAGVPDATWGEVGVAFVVLREGATATGAELAAFLEGRLARYKLPRDYRFMAQLPRTAYGKVLKGELREDYLRGSGRP